MSPFYKNYNLYNNIGLNKVLNIIITMNVNKNSNTLDKDEIYNPNMSLWCRRGVDAFQYYINICLDAFPKFPELNKDLNSIFQ